MVEAPAIPATACELVDREINKYSEWDHRIMSAIARSENDTCDPLRHNETSSETHANCVGSYGVLQVGCIHYAPGQDRDDLATNVQIAYAVWQKQGYRAWTEYKNNGYLEHLK